MPNGVHRNRTRVLVRSYVTGHVLRVVSELEAREMCDEDSHGNRRYLREPEAYRFSRKKAPLQEICLIAPQRGKSQVKATLTFADTLNNAFGKAFNVAGGPEIRVRPMERAEAKVDAWPEVHDDKAVVICAGKVHGVTFVANVEAR